MQKLDNKDTSKRILEELKKELLELIRQNNSNKEDFETLKKTIERIHQKLNEFEAEKKGEKVPEHKKYSNYVSAQIEEDNDEYDVNIRKKLAIKKKEKVNLFLGGYSTIKTCKEK